MSRRGFGWRWLAASFLCFLLLVFLVIRDVRVRRENAAEHVSKESARKPGTALFPKVDADEATAPLIAEPLTGIEMAPAPTDSATASMLPTALVFQKTRIVSNSPTAGIANLVSIRDIQPAFMKSPVYVLAQGPAKAFTPRTWLRVVVTFDSFEAHIDELTFQYKITFGDITFGGLITHADILATGEHHVAAFIAPSGVEPLIQGRDFDANKSVAIDVLALHRLSEISRASFGRQTVVGQRERLGFVRSVEETPFAPLEIDLYELRITAPALSRILGGRAR